MITPRLALISILFFCGLIFISGFVYDLAFIPEGLKIYASVIVSGICVYAFSNFIQKHGHKF